MYRNTTPTNDLVIEGATLFSELLATLQTPHLMYINASATNRRPVPYLTDASRVAIEDAARFWDMAVTSYLLSALQAFDRLTEVCLDRATSTFEPNGRFDRASRHDIKTARHTIGVAEAQVRRALAQTEDELHVALSDMVTRLMRGGN